MIGQLNAKQKHLFLIVLGTIFLISSFLVLKDRGLPAGLVLDEIVHSLNKKKCALSFNTGPLRSPVMGTLRASWAFKDTLANLYTANPDYLSVIENRRENIEPLSGSDISVPLPIVLGVIHTESAGKVYPGCRDEKCLCNKFGFCGLMQVNQEKCQADPSCDWDRFMEGDIDAQVSPGIRYLGYIGGLLVKNGMDTRHPDLWYFAAMAYNGGVARVVCGNSACTDTDGTVIGNIMGMKGYKDINKIRFEDVLASIRFDDQGNLVRKGVFADLDVSVSDAGARQMLAHALRTGEAAEEFAQNQECEINTPNLETIPFPSDLGSGLGYYFLNPSFRVAREFDWGVYKQTADTARALLVDCQGDDPAQILVCISSRIPENWNINYCNIFSSAELDCLKQKDHVPSFWPGGDMAACRSCKSMAGCKEYIDERYCNKDPCRLGCIWDGSSCRKETEVSIDPFKIKFCVDSGFEIYVWDDVLYKKTPLTIKFALDFSTAEDDTYFSCPQDEGKICAPSYFDPIACGGEGTIIFMNWCCEPYNGGCYTNEKLGACVPVWTCEGLPT